MLLHVTCSFRVCISAIRLQSLNSLSVFSRNALFPICRAVCAKMSWTGCLRWRCICSSSILAHQPLQCQKNCSFISSLSQCFWMLSLPKTCSGYQSAFVRFLVCSRSSTARLCSFCFSPKSRTTSQLSPLTASHVRLECTSYTQTYLLFLPLIHRQVTQSSRGCSKKSRSDSLFSSYCSILSMEKSTAVI